MRSLVLPFLSIVVLTFCSDVTRAQSEFSFEKGDRICIIGNTLADRMQHDGWLETHLQLRFPDKQLVLRNLGFSGDTLKTRLRSSNFGSPEKHLTENKADVVFLMFGYNESFAGEAGLSDFKSTLKDEIRFHLSKKYNGESAPRLIVCSPIAHEDLGTPNLPDGRENNERLAKYTAAMKSVSEEAGVTFVDLFNPTLKLYERTEEPMTINGIHLNPLGNQKVAEVISNSLFGSSNLDAAKLSPTRKAVRQKNFYWYNLYRTTDGYSIFGGRAALKFTDGQTNRVVMKREMDILQVMTDNRDPAIWAAANGKEFAVDDSNTPDFIPVISNKPGSGPNGEHVFLSGEEVAKQMRVLDGFQVNLFASEEQFPELINPVQMAFDTKGRLFVAAWESYPHWKPKDEMNDKLLILEDTDGDGKADKCKTFADNLHNPTGFEFWGGGVLVAMAPEILFLEDTDGDDVADKRTIVLHGFDTADTHHTANSFTMGPGGGIYFQEGTFHHTQVETPYKSTLKTANGAVFRYDPRQQDVIVYTPKSYANPHGHVFDRWGQDIIHDGTGAVPYHGTLISSHLDFPNKHGGAPPVYNRRTRPLPATEVLSSRHFPDEMQDELLVQNVIGDLGILRYRITDNGSSLAGKELEPLLLSDDQNFRPVDMEIGPHGELFFTDWANPIIGHMQHNIRDPNRDRKHGRVYRLTHKTRPLGKREQIAGRTIPELLDNLLQMDNRIRYRTRIELSARDSGEVIKALESWVAKLDSKDEHHESHLLEALWLHQQHNVANRELLEQCLTADDFRGRAAATKVLCYWRDKFDDSHEVMIRSAADSSPRVRLEALRAASFFEASRGLPIMLRVLDSPTDKYLDWLAKEVIRAFPEWQTELVSAQLLDNSSVAAADFFLGKMSSTNVQRLPMTKPVCEHLVLREGVGEATRGSAIQKLAELNSVSEVSQLMSAVNSIAPQKTPSTVVNELVRLMAARTPDELKSVRSELAKMAKSAKLPLLRKIGYVGMVTADKSVDEAWKASAGSTEKQVELVSAISMIPDPGLQREFFDKVFPLVSNNANAAIGKSTSVNGRFVRVELPGDRRTLTLAEVQVFAGDENVAMRGSATQSATGHSAGAEKGIDGNTSSEFSKGGQTHTPENRRNPWWEVDLGEPFEIEKIAIFNREDGSLGKRLDGYTLKILDSSRRTVYIQKNQPAPTPVVEFEIGTISAAAKLRNAAIDSISYIQGKEKQSYAALSKLVLNDVNSNVAIRSIQRIPSQFWEKESASELVKTVLDKVKQTPAASRNSTASADAMQFVDSLANLLEKEEAERVRLELADLGVRVIRIGTKPHRMAYDKELLVVAAGKPVEIIFENTDMMPHNLVITTPGAMEAVGQQAEVEATRKNAIKTHYVPNMNQVLLSSKLIQPGQEQRLTFEVPTEPGAYAYVCTYPGHWRRMFGIMMVVEEPAKYMADPDKYASDNNIEIKDELLKLVLRTKTEWKVDDFAKTFEGDASEFVNARSFNTGRQMFQLSSCISCHKMNGEGYEIGPDLSKDLDPKWDAQAVLREILEPSKKIDEKFRTQMFVLESGETVSGIVTFEDEHMVKLVENPLVATDAKTIEKFEIEDERVSDVSIMPKGLLDTLTRQEILDLVAYIMAKGDPKHHLFKDGDHSKH